MEDLKGFIWVIAAVVFLIWRMVQKAVEKAREAQDRQPARQPGSAPAPRPAPAVPAVSFEELLAQMQRQNQSQTAPPVAERALPQEEQEQELEQERRPARPVAVARFPRPENTEVEIYSQELPAPEARSLEGPKRALRLGSALPRTSTQHGTEDFWSQKTISPKQTRRTVNELLQNPADLRAAFVLSEILQRKW